MTGRYPPPHPPLKKTLYFPFSLVSHLGPRPSAAVLPLPCKESEEGALRERCRTSAWQVAIHSVQLWLPLMLLLCLLYGQPHGATECGLRRPTEARLLSRASHAALFHRETWTRRVFAQWLLRQREQQEGRAAEKMVRAAFGRGVCVCSVHGSPAESVQASPSGGASPRPSLAPQSEGCGS